MAPQVTVIGDATLDVRAVPAIPLRAGRDVPATVTVGPGGQGANIAVRLARRGIRTRLVCRIGDDAAGALLRAAIVRDGVELIDGGAPFTGSVVVLVDEGGERTMLSQRVPLLDPVAMPSPSVLEGDWVVVSGYVLLEPSAGISMTGRQPRRAIAGCALEPGRVEEWASAARSLRPHLVVLNADEARAVAARDGDPGQLSRWVGDALSAVVVVTEPAGAAADLDGTLVSAAPDEGDAPIDTTGAGDAFAAALVAELCDGVWPPPAGRLEAALGVAAAVAAAVTRVPGAQSRVPGEG